MNNITDIARLVQPPTKSHTVLAKLTSRPLRVAFIIRNDIQKNNFTKILEFNSLIWGGVYNCLAPTNGEDIDEFWWQNLAYYRPDIVVFCGDSNGLVVSDSLEKKVKRSLQPFAVNYWDKWDYQMRPGDRHRHSHIDRLLGCLPMVYPLQHVVDSWKEPLKAEDSNVAIPEIERSHPYYHLVAVQAGLALDDYQKIYKEIFKARVVDFCSTDFEEYLSKLGQLEQYLNPLAATKSNTRLSYTSMFPYTIDGLKIVLIGNNWLDDVCTFWSLRLTEKLFLENDKAILLPVDLLRSTINLQNLCSAIQRDGAWYSYQVTLLSRSVKKKQLDRLQKRLQTQLGQQTRVQIAQQMPKVSLFSLKSNEETQRIKIEDSHFILERVSPEFGEPEKEHANWAVDVEFNPGYEFPTFSTLNYHLCSTPDDWRVKRGYWLRYIESKLIYRASASSNYYGGQLPRADVAFETIFQDANYSTKTTDKRAYAEGFLSMLGSSVPLRKSAIRFLLWEMSNAKAYEYKQIIGFLRRGQMEIQECSGVVDEFAKKRILLKGMDFRCEWCGLSRWYPINVIDEELQCAGCLNVIRPPTNAPIKFRLNELVIRAVTQGAIPVLLTESFIRNHNFSKPLTLYGIELTDAAKSLIVDVDLLTTCREQLVLAECKEFKEGTRKSELTKSCKQLTTLAEIAKQLGAIAILSTLLPLDSPNTTILARHALRLNKRFKIPIHLICLVEMGFVDLKNPVQIAKNRDIFSIWRS